MPSLTLLLWLATVIPQETSLFRFHGSEADPSKDAETRLARHEEFLTTVTNRCPKDWRPKSKQPVTVLDSSNPRFAKNLADTLAVTWGWMDDRFEVVGAGRTARPPLVLLCPDRQEMEKLQGQLRLDSDFDAVFWTWNVPVTSNNSGASGRFQSFGASGPDEPGETNRLRRELAIHWFVDRDRHLFWSLPGWLHHGLVATASGYELKGRRLVPPAFLNHKLRQMLARAPLRPMQEFWTTTAYSPMEFSQGNAWIAFFLDGPGAKKSSWKGRLERFLVEAGRVVREIEAEDSTESVPRNRRDEAEQLRTEREAWEAHSPRVTNTAFERAFGDLEESDVRALEASFLRFVEEE